MADVAIVTDAGLGIITSRMKGEGTEPKYIHWGTGTNTPIASNTTLQSPGPEARVQGISSRETTNVANDTYQVVGILTCTGSAKTITEAGLFDAATGGNLYVRGTFSPINVSVGDSIQFTIRVVYDQG